MQARLQTPPPQLVVPLAAVGQEVHEEPQLLTLVFEEQAPLQLWYPALQVDPQEVPSQVAAPFAGTGQALHELPQLVVLVLSAQVVPQAW